MEKGNRRATIAPVQKNILQLQQYNRVNVDGGSDLITSSVVKRKADSVSAPWVAKDVVVPAPVSSI